MVFPQARQQAQLRHQMAEDSKAEYSSTLQKFNSEQHEHYYTHIPNIFQVRVRQDSRAAHNPVIKALHITSVLWPWLLIFADFFFFLVVLSKFYMQSCHPERWEDKLSFFLKLDIKASVIHKEGDVEVLWQMRTDLESSQSFSVQLLCLCSWGWGRASLALLGQEAAGHCCICKAQQPFITCVQIMDM